MKIAQEAFEGHRESSDGYCTSCSQWSLGGVEPDAEEYECECCGESAVMGAENALLFGEVEIE